MYGGMGGGRRGEREEDGGEWGEQMNDSGDEMVHERMGDFDTFDGYCILKDDR